MTDIALGLVVQETKLIEFFDDVLPGVHVSVQDIGTDMASDFDVCVSAYPNPSEFPFGLGVIAAMRPGRDFEVWLQGLA